MKDSKFENLITELNKQLQKQKTCAEKGHLGEVVQSVSSYGFQTRASCYCTECKAVYSRRATQSEINKFNEVVYRPFTF